MFCRKTKNRVCTSHNPQMVLFKTNTTITEPKPACRSRSPGSHFDCPEKHTGGFQQTQESRDEVGC